MESFDRQLNLRVKTVWDGSGMAQATSALKKQVDNLNNGTKEIENKMSGGGGKEGRSETEGQKKQVEGTTQSVRKWRSELNKVKKEYREVYQNIGTMAGVIQKTIDATNTQAEATAQAARLRGAMLKTSDRIFETQQNLLTATGKEVPILAEKLRYEEKLYQMQGRGLSAYTSGVSAKFAAEQKLADSIIKDQQTRLKNEEKITQQMLSDSAKELKAEEDRAAKVRAQQDKDFAATNKGWQKRSDAQGQADEKELASVAAQADGIKKLYKKNAEEKTKAQQDLEKEDARKKTQATLPSRKYSDLYEQRYNDAYVEQTKRKTKAQQDLDAAEKRALIRLQQYRVEMNKTQLAMHRAALAENRRYKNPQTTWQRIQSGASHAWKQGTQAWDRARGTAVRGTMALISVMYLLNMAFRTASQVIQPFINMFKQFGTMVVKFTKDLVMKAGEIENVTMRSAGLFKDKAEGNTAWAIQEAVGKPFNFEDIMKALTIGKAFALDKTAGGEDTFYKSIIPAVEDMAAASGNPMEDAIKAMAQGLNGRMDRLTRSFGTTAFDIARYGGVLNSQGTGISSDPRYREQNLTAMLKSIEARFGGTTDAMANTMKGLSEDMADIWIRVAYEFRSSGFYQYFKDTLLQLRNTFIQFSSGKYAGVLQNWVKRFSDGLMGLKPLVDAVLPYLPHYVDAVVTGMENFGKVFKQASESGLIQKVAGGFKVFIDFMFTTGTQVIDLFYRNITEWSVTLLGVADAAIHILPLAAEGLARFIAIIAGTLGTILQSFSGTKAIGDPLVTAANQIWQFADTLAVKMPVIVNTISGGIQQLQQTLINGANGFKPDGSLPLADRISAQTKTPKTAMSPEDLSDGTGGEGEGGTIGSAKRAATLLAGEVEKMDNKFGALYNEAISKSFDISQAQREYNAILSDQLDMKQGLLSIEEEIAAAQAANDDARVEGLKKEKEALQGQIDLADQGKDAIKKQITVAEELAASQKKMTDGQKKMTELAAEFLKPMGALGMRFIRKHKEVQNTGTGSSVLGMIVAENQKYNAAQAMAPAIAGGGGAAAPYSYAYGGGSTPSSMGAGSTALGSALDSSFGSMIGTSSAVNPTLNPEIPAPAAKLTGQLQTWANVGGAAATGGATYLLFLWADKIYAFLSACGNGIGAAVRFLVGLGTRVKEFIQVVKILWPYIQANWGRVVAIVANRAIQAYLTLGAGGAGAGLMLPNGPMQGGKMQNIPGMPGSVPKGSDQVASVPSTVGGEGLNVSTSKDKFGNATIRIANTGMAYNSGIANFA